MTKSKWIKVSPARSGILQYDTLSAKPMCSSQTSVSLLINPIPVAHLISTIKLLVLVF